MMDGLRGREGLLYMRYRVWRGGCLLRVRNGDEGRKVCVRGRVCGNGNDRYGAAGLCGGRGTGMMEGAREGGGGWVGRCKV